MRRSSSVEEGSTRQNHQFATWKRQAEVGVCSDHVSFSNSFSFLGRRAVRVPERWNRTGWSRNSLNSNCLRLSILSCDMPASKRCPGSGFETVQVRDEIAHHSGGPLYPGGWHDFFGAGQSMDVPLEIAYGKPPGARIITLGAVPARISANEEDGNA
jgi:hypothetical protein